MATSRYALTLKDGTIANIVAWDPDSEGGQNFATAMEKVGVALVPLTDSATTKCGNPVEPGDKCDAEAKTFIKSATPRAILIDTKESDSDEISSAT